MDVRAIIRGAALVAPAVVLRAQPCTPAWNPGFPALDGAVRALAIFDDGGGPALFVGGSFTTAAGGQTLGRIAKWDGSAWRSVGGGLNGTVNAMMVYNDGSGPALFVGGAFTRAGGLGANGIAKWNGVQWTGLQQGVQWGVSQATTPPTPAPLAPGVVNALAVFDEGAGPTLFVGGDFDSAGPSFAQGIARWNGVWWSNVGQDFLTPGRPRFAPVYALAPVTLGGARMLAVGGGFRTDSVGPMLGQLAAWDGAAWSAVGFASPVPTSATQPDGVLSLAAAADQPGRPGALYVGLRIAAWAQRGAVGRWQGPGALVEVYPPPANIDGVGSLTVFDDGAGPALYAGAALASAGYGAGLYRTPMAGFPAGAWAPVAGPPANGAVLATLVTGPGGVPGGLYVGGSFSQIGGVAAARIARFGCAAAATPGAFGLLQPPNGAVAQARNPAFQWQDAPTAGAVLYTVVVATDAALTNAVYTAANIVGTRHTPPANALPPGVRYFWGVRAANLAGSSPSAPVSFSFATRAVGDANGDGTVDFADLVAVLGQYGVTP